MNFYNRHKFGIVSVILIAFFFAIFAENIEAASACDELRKTKEHAEDHLETAQMIHAAASALLMSAITRRSANEFMYGKKEPSDETIAELTAATAVAYAVLKMEQISFDEAQKDYAICLRLHRHSCGCPSTTHSQTSCSCSKMRSGYYGVGVNCPCYDSSPS